MHFGVNRTRPFTHKQGHFVINPSLAWTSLAAGFSVSGSWLYSTLTVTSVGAFSAANRTPHNIGFEVRVTSPVLLPLVESAAGQALQTTVQAIYTSTFTTIVYSNVLFPPLMVGNSLFSYHLQRNRNVFLLRQVLLVYILPYLLRYGLRHIFFRRGLRSFSQ